MCIGGCPYEELLEMGLNCLKEEVKLFGTPGREGPDGLGNIKEEVEDYLKELLN